MQNEQLAGPKIALHLPCLLVCMCIHTYTWAIIMSCTLLACACLYLI